MKIVLINSEFNEKTGISKAYIQTDLGVFVGKAKLHNDDKENASSFAGCRYAEIRAIIKYLKRKIDNVNYEIKGLSDYQKLLKGMKDYNHNSVENRKLRRRIYELNKKKSGLNEQISSLNKKLIDLITQRDKVITSLSKAKEENKDG